MRERWVIFQIYVWLYSRSIPYVGVYLLVLDQVCSVISLQTFLYGPAEEKGSGMAETRLSGPKVPLG